MSKKDEKIIISKKLAEDLIWWLDHADVPFNDGWLRRYVNGNREFTQMEIARDSMVEELERAIKQAEKGNETK